MHFQQYNKPTRSNSTISTHSLLAHLFLYQYGDHFLFLTDFLCLIFIDITDDFAAHIFELHLHPAYQLVILIAFVYLLSVCLCLLSL